MYSDTFSPTGLPHFVAPNDKPVWEDVSEGFEITNNLIKDIQQNAADQTTQTTGNSSAIKSLQDSLKTVDQQITDIQTDVTQNMSDISANAVNITKLQGDYQKLDADLTTLHQGIGTVSDIVTTLESTVATNTSNITGNTDSINLLNKLKGGALIGNDYDSTFNKQAVSTFGSRVGQIWLSNFMATSKSSQLFPHFNLYLTNFNSKFMVNDVGEEVYDIFVSLTTKFSGINNYELVGFAIFRTDNGLGMKTINNSSINFECEKKTDVNSPTGYYYSSKLLLDGYSVQPTTLYSIQYGVDVFMV